MLVARRCGSLRRHRFLFARADCEKRVHAPTFSATAGVEISVEAVSTDPPPSSPTSLLPPGVSPAREAAAGAVPVMPPVFGVVVGSSFALGDAGAVNMK